MVPDGGFQLTKILRISERKDDASSDKSKNERLLVERELRVDGFR
jgi:hypothetical protein